jgi:DNA helicase-2/ATP-dependent DNA helicase PcrA
MMEVIFGPPGTGKTTTLLSIVEEELAHGTRPVDIGYFSFTKKATRVAIDGAVRLFDKPRKEFQYFRTLHSLALRSLHIDRTAVMQDDDYTEFSNLIGYNIKNPDNVSWEIGYPSYEDPYLSLIDKYRIKYTSLYQEFKEYGHLEGGWKKLEKIDRGYKEFKAKRDLYDFTDMLYNLIEDEEKIPSFKVLIIDEAQDLSKLQWKLVDKLIERSEKIYIAGDDDQAIFGWAGGDVQELLIRANRPSTRKSVLHQSHRVPIDIHSYCTALINRNKKRQPKVWKPRQEKGLIDFPAQVNLSLFDKGQWLLLASTGYHLDKISTDMKQHGLYFIRRKGTNEFPSVSSDAINAMYTWEKLREGKEISLEEVKLIYSYISSKTGLKWGAKKMEGALDHEKFNFERLKSQHGLLLAPHAPWLTALDRIKERDVRMIKSLLLRNEDLTKPPRIIVSTIHGAKGGEADNVMLLTDMSRKGMDGYYKDSEETRKVFYTGMTRAKKELHVVAPETDIEFGEIRYEHQKRTQISY